MNIEWALDKLREYRRMLSTYDELRQQGQTHRNSDELRELAVQLDRRFMNVQAIIDAFRLGLEVQRSRALRAR